MSEENVEIVRRGYAAFNEHRIDELAELTSPRFRWEPNPDDPEREPREGLNETVRFLEAQWEALPDLRTEIEEAIDGGSDVVAIVRHTAMVPGSKDQIERREAHVWTIEGGKIARLRELAIREQALEAAGLSE